MGQSRPWEDAMEVMDGQRKMDASALMEYFDPLHQWLIKQNKGEKVGWDEKCPIISSSAFMFTPVPLLILCLVGIYNLVL